VICPQNTPKEETVEGGWCPFSHFPHWTKSGFAEKGKRREKNKKENLIVEPF